MPNTPDEERRARNRELAAMRRASDPVGIKARKKASYLKQRDADRTAFNAKAKERNARCRAKNPAKVKTWSKKWQTDNPERWRLISIANAANYKARFAGCDDYLKHNDLAKLYEKSNGICPVCNNANKLTIDHVVPLSRGGKNTIANIQLLCGPCNSSKQDREWTEFLSEK